jgi:membrane-bound ClpP family serine protease
MTCRIVFFVCCILNCSSIFCAPPLQSTLEGEISPVEVKTIGNDEAVKERFLQSIHLTPQSWIGRIVINDKKQGISEATWMYVQAAIDSYKEKKPACVILELNTPGGEVFAAQRISNAIRSLEVKDGIPVIAYVNNWAISAGAMLAYSCRYIIVAPDASMGAATPVFQTSEGMSAAPEKVNSALRSDFANRASFFNRNPDIARAMVDPDIILIRRGGQIIALASESELHSGADGNDEIISPKGKLLTLTADQMKDLGVVDAEIPKNVAFSPDEEIPQGTLLCKTPFRAVPGLSDFPNIPIETFQMDMKTSIVTFLVSPVVSSALVFVTVVCFYLEMSAPGVVLPGIVGGVALFLLLIGSFAQEAVTWFEPLCIVIGLGIIAIELTFFPTLGILLLVGGALLVFGIASLVIPGIESVRFDGDMLNAAGDYALHRLAWLSGSFLLAIAVIIMVSRHLSLKTLRFSGIILEKTSPTEEQLLHISTGDEADVVAALRPAGKIECGGRLFDAVSDGRYIEERTRVHVVEVRGNVIFVESIPRNVSKG